MAQEGPKPEEVNFRRPRGDVNPIVFTDTKPSGQPEDNATWSYLLTVNTLKAPPDNSTQVIQLVGVVGGDDGKVTFAPTLAEADQLPNTYFFDIQRIDAFGPRTMAEGNWEVTQDKTKEEA